MMASVPKGLWARVESLFLDRYCPGFWSQADIDLPYGHVMVIDPDDMPTMLWRGDLIKNPDFNSILGDLGRIENEHNVPVGCALSSSWAGDVDGFKKHLAAAGFGVKTRMCWLAKDIRIEPAEEYQSGFVIGQTQDLPSFARIMAMGFSPAVADIFLKGALRNADDAARVYFDAKDRATGQVVGCYAACNIGDVAYVSCLAVDPAFGRRGIAKDMVRASVDYLRSQGVGFVVTAVNEKNAASMAVQKRSGYEIFETVEYWMKN